MQIARRPSRKASRYSRSSATQITTPSFGSLKGPEIVLYLTASPERTMYRRVERFEREGMASLFGTDPAATRAKRQGLEPAIRRMIVDLKAEHPALNHNEISNIVYVRTGRRLGDHTAAGVLSEEVVPLKLSRLFEPYHETEDSGNRRGAVVALHLDGWSAKPWPPISRSARRPSTG